MANSSLNLSSLDFDTLKTNLKTYLKSQATFKDYDFEGSNMNVLLDVLSYNTYLNSFYLNMIGSEMFLDTAQKYDSIVSHAKELNYVPQSNKSSVAFIKFSVNTVGIPRKFTIPKGVRFSGINSNGTFSFSTAETTTYVSANSTYAIANLAIYDGVYNTETFSVDYTIENQKFVLSNPDIDVESLSIHVIENNGESNNIFNRVDTLYNLSANSKVFFLQAAQNNQYEVLFGDNVLGRRPQNGAIVQAEYRIAKGAPANGINAFSCDVSLGIINDGIVNMGKITVLQNSTSGAMAEGLESIRYKAPRYFATQQRAVSVDDFSSLVLSKFGGEISDVNVYGGENLNPKQYGRVVVCIKPKGLTYSPNYLKNQVTTYLDSYVTLPTRVIITDPDYIYLGVESIVQYDKTLTKKFETDVENLIYNTITNFSINNLEAFKNDFRYSRFVNQIDNSDVSIVSNDTKVTLIKKIITTPGIGETVTIEYNNPGEVEGKYYGVTYLDEPTLTTEYSIGASNNSKNNTFSYISIDGIQYNNCFLRDDNAGKLIIYQYVNSVLSTITADAGTIDYATGKVVIKNFNILNYDATNGLRVYYKPSSKDTYASKDKIIVIDPSDVYVNVISKLD